jgi:hypothetical protein
LIGYEGSDGFVFNGYCQQLIIRLQCAGSTLLRRTTRTGDFLKMLWEDELNFIFYVGPESLGPGIFAKVYT